MFSLDGAKRHAFELAVVFLALGALAYLFYSGSSSWTLSLLLVFGLMLAIMDTALGMGYGTIGTPILLILGFSSVVAVPAILIAQAVSASFGSVVHRKFKHADILDFGGRDGKVAVLIAFFGVVGAVIGVALALSLPRIYVNTYIGLLVISMGLILIVRPLFSFSWRRLSVFGLVGGFNKAISGGGFGPMAMTGQLVSGNGIKNSVGIALFSVAVINVISFALYVSAHSIPDFRMPLALSIGAILGSQLGPRVTKMINKGRFVYRMFAIFAMVLGFLTIVTTFIKF